MAAARVPVSPPKHIGREMNTNARFPSNVTHARKYVANAMNATHVRIASFSQWEPQFPAELKFLKS